LKTKLDLVVIDDSDEIARKRAQQFYKGIPDNKLEIENLQYMVHLKVYQDK
jgi:hypothetical protein